MQTKPLLDLILQLLEDMKAKDIVILNVRSLTDIMDSMIICSGTSTRHTQSIAEYLTTQTKVHGVSALGVEGQEYGDWILVDLGDVVVHIMLPETREFYSLEKLWSTTPQQSL